MPKKPNLSTVEADIERKGVYISPEGHTIKMTFSGMFTLTKYGTPRTFSTLRDAWRGL